MVVMLAVSAALAVIFAGLAFWAYMQYTEQKSDVEGRVELAVLQGKQEQAEESERQWREREAETTSEFVGPDDYGRLSFRFPRHWSVHEATDITRGGDYEAYLNPGKVPPISNNQQFAIRVTIENTDYDRVVQSYASKIRNGDLRSSATSSQGITGTRLDGNFNNNIRGSAVIYKIRDKTATIRTDADTFRADFDRLIQTIDFVQ